MASKQPLAELGGIDFMLQLWISICCRIGSGIIVGHHWNVRLLNDVWYWSLWACIPKSEVQYEYCCWLQAHQIRGVTMLLLQAFRPEPYQWRWWAAGAIELSFPYPFWALQPGQITDQCWVRSIFCLQIHTAPYSYIEPKSVCLTSAT